MSIQQKSSLAFVISLLCVVSLFADLAYYPKTTIAELCTATWCGYCPQAYQGLEVVHNTYDYSEFISARYYATSGDYGTPETNSMINYYNVTGFPTAIFNGTERVVGGGAAVASGTPYLSIVDAAYFNPSPLKIDIGNFDPISGEISVILTMYDPELALEDTYLRFILLEDNVAGYHTHVTRDIITETFSLTGQGNTLEFVKTFDINETWDTEELHAVVYVQDPSDKAVLQAYSTYDTPEFNVRAVVPFPKIELGPSSEQYEGEFFSIVNTGSDDDYTISLIVDEAPSGWMATFCDDQGNCYFGDADFSLTSGENMDFHVNIMPASPGMMRYHFSVTSSNLDNPLNIPFTYITNDVDVILVDDDGGEGFENYYASALTENEVTFGIWDLDKLKLTDAVLENIPCLVWNIGWSFPSLDEEDRAFLENYLDAGNSLFISGQDIGWDLNDPNSGNTDPAFYNNYLHAIYIRDDTNIYYLSGVSDDPISDGLNLHIAGGDGANNQDYPSEISAYDDDTIEIFHYQGNGAGAIRAQDSDSGARIVYLAFGFEAVDNIDDRAALMGSAVNWLTETFGVNSTIELPNQFILKQNNPNPFSTSTTISFNLHSASPADLTGQAEIKIYNIKGQLVRELGFSPPAGGSDLGFGEAIWDGTDEHGRPVPSGIYFYKMSINADTPIKKMLLIR